MWAKPVQSDKKRVMPKLQIGRPGDRFEQQADRVADAVVRMPDKQVQRQPMEDEEETIQMKSADEEKKIQMQPDTEEEKEKFQMQSEEEEKLQMKCEECEKQQDLQMKPAIQLKESGDTYASQEFANHVNSSKNQGKPLRPDIQREMSQKIGSDFSGVQVHTGSRAVKMNDAIGARAFTVGQNIYFNANQYAPHSNQGKRLLAHELTHTMQQGGSPEMVQADFAIAPSTPERAITELTDAQVTEAIEYNRERHSDVNEITLIRDILGLNPRPPEINENFIRGLLQYQAQYGLTQDGKLGPRTAERLAREIITAGDFLGEDNLGDLAPEFVLKTNLRALVTADNKNYTDYKTAIEARTMLQQFIALLDQQLLKDLKGQLTWNNWARCIELLGRRAPSGNTMRRNSIVRTAMRGAWNDSDPDTTIWAAHNPDPALAGHPCNPAPGVTPVTNAHEEGGFIYMNLITGNFTTRRVAAGGQAGLVLDNPPNVSNSIVVGGFHTHPNVGNCWGAPFFSGADNNWSANNGVPILMIGAFPAVANTSFHATGSRRRHLAGNRGLPGAAGGLAPQATKYGEHDAL